MGSVILLYLNMLLFFFCNRFEIYSLYIFVMCENICSTVMLFKKNTNVVNQTVIPLCHFFLPPLLPFFFKRFFFFMFCHVTSPLSLSFEKLQLRQLVCSQGLEIHENIPSEELRVKSTNLSFCYTTICFLVITFNSPRHAYNIVPLIVKTANWFILLSLFLLSFFLLFL